MARGAISILSSWTLTGLLIWSCASTLACTSSDPDDAGEETNAEGETGGECVNDSDCADPAEPFCVHGYCESGEAEAPCEFDGDCSMEAPYCSFDMCSAGALGDACEFDDKCVSMICGADICTEGNEGDPCEFASDCNETAPFCPDVTLMCTDGSEGDACEFDNECMDGLTCEAELCTAP